jgi:hypothetical protein
MAAQATALQRPEPTGVRFVLSNCAVPGREAELAEWYDRYAADCTRPGLLVNAVRYERRSSVEDGQPRFVAVYDTVDSNLGSLWPQSQNHPAREVHTRSALLSVVLKSTYRRIDPVLPIGSTPLPKSIALVLCDCKDPAAEGGLDAWVAERIRHLVEDGHVSRGSRYEIVEGEPSPAPQFLEIYESRSSDIPELVLEDRPSSAVTKFSGIYTRTFAYP